MTALQSNIHHNTVTTIHVNQSIMKSFSIIGKQDGERKMIVIKQEVPNRDT